MDGKRKKKEKKKATILPAAKEKKMQGDSLNLSRKVKKSLHKKKTSRKSQKNKRN